MSSSRNTELNIETYRSGRSSRSRGGGRSRSYSRSGSRSGGYRSNNRGASIASLIKSSSIKSSSNSSSSDSSRSSSNRPSFSIDYRKKIPVYTQTSTSNTLGRIGGVETGWGNPYWGWEGQEHSWMYPLVVEPSEIISISEYNELVNKKAELERKREKAKEKELKKIEKFYKY
jgi:hypothetical protein